jgi:hypothetical protein
MFRRKQEDEDPFAALKDATERGSTTVATGGSPSSSASSASAGSSSGLGGDGPSATQVSGVPGSARDRRGNNGFLVLLTIVLALGGAGALVWLSEGDAPAGADAGYFTSTPGGAPPDEPWGDDEGSDDKPSDPPKEAHYDLLRPATFKQALNGIERQLRPAERVYLLRIARDRINASTRLRNGRQRQIDVDDALQVQTREAGFAGSHRGMPLSQLDPQAPALAVRKAAATGGFPASRLDYLVLLSPLFPGDTPRWSLFFRDVAPRNAHWIASLDGRALSRPGEQPASTGSGSTRSDSITIRTDRGTTTLTGEDARRVGDCIQRAGSDGSAIQECLP